MALYAYISSAGRKVISGDIITFTGAWSGSTAYVSRDAATDSQGHNWIALVANTNVALPTVFDVTEYTTWAHLVQIEADVTVANPAYAGDWLLDVWNGTNYSVGLFDQAYSLAETGTNAAAAALAIANQALALSGTNSVGAFMPLLQQAYNLGVAGTTAANSADMWGRDAFSLAVAGTNAADQAYALADQALTTAWSGTQAADSADMWGRDAFSLAVTGTDAAAGANSQATAAFSVATTALGTAWVGTNAASAANSIAVSALNTAWAGTYAAYLAKSAADNAYYMADYSLSVTLDVEKSLNRTAVTALNTAWVGTNAAKAANSIAVSALNTAWVGTNAASAANSIAVSALNTAWAGTASVSSIVTGGTIGQVLKKNSSTAGDIRWSDMVEYGTLLPATGTITLDLSSSTPRLRSIAISAPTSFATSNVSAGNWISVRMSTNGTASAIYFGENWSWLGTSCAGSNTLTAGKYAVLSLTCFGQSQTDIVAAWVAQA